MGLKTYGLLTILSASLVTPKILAGENVTFYGNIATAYHTHQRTKIDTSDADISNAVSRSGATVYTKDQNYSVIGSGYTDSKFGLDFTASKKVTGKLEFKAAIGETGTDQPASVQKYYLSSDLGVGNLKLGRDVRIFSSVAYYTDSFNFANLWFAGSVYGPEHGTGISFDSSDLLGAINFKLGLLNPTAGTSEAKPQGGNSEPSVEAMVGYHRDTFGADFALISEKRTVNYIGGDNPTWDVANGLAYSLGVWANISFLEATFVYTGGDALYDSVTQGAVMSKKKNDQMSAFATYLKASFGDVKAALYLGMQTLSHSKKNGATDKDGNSKTIDDVGTTYGIHLGYDWKELTFAGEAINTTRAYDGQTIENDTYFSIGALTSFSS
ncbi:MAG: hypothetical protein AB8G05_03755 [Oligoflexales bacterium]